MKKLLTEATFKRLIKTFINEDISKVKNGKLLNWIKTFNQKANTNYDENELANIVIEFSELQGKGGLKINNTPVDILSVRTDEQLKQVIDALQAVRKKQELKNQIKGMSGQRRTTTLKFNGSFQGLPSKEKFQLLKQYCEKPSDLFPDKKYVPIPTNEFKNIEDAFQTNAERGASIAYAVWYVLICFKGYKRAEDASIIKKFIDIYNEYKAQYPLEITKINTKQEFDEFYNISAKINSEKSSGNISTSGYVTEMVSKYPQFYKGDFSDQKYGQTYAYFQLPKITKDQVQEYVPVFRDLGMWTTWCVSAGWDDEGKTASADNVERYATQDIFSILINKADPKNSVNGKFALNSADKDLRNLSDQGVFGG